MMEVEIAKISIFMGILNNFQSDRIQRVVDLDGSADDRKLCAEIMHLFCSLDSYSGLMDEMYAFTSEAIIFIAGKNKVIERQIKIDKIKKLQEEVAKLEEEIK